MTDKTTDKVLHRQDAANVDLAELAMGLHLTKEASGAELLKRIGTNMGNVMLDRVLPMGAVAGSVYLGSMAMRRHADAQAQAKFNKSLNKVMMTNSVVRAADKSRVKELAQSIYELAPNAAGDPNVLSSVLATVVYGEGLDPRTARDLMELEEKYYRIKEIKSPAAMEVAKMAIGGDSWRKYDPETITMMEAAKEAAKGTH